MKTVPSISAMLALSLANQWLGDRLPDRFTADWAEPSLVEDRWQVPVILTYPGVGALGRVGMIWVSTKESNIVSSTPVDEMKQIGEKLLAEHLDEIEAAFS